MGGDYVLPGVGRDYASSARHHQRAWAQQDKCEDPAFATGDVGGHSLAAISPEGAQSQRGTDLRDG
jgi:hypothetical protein